MFCNIEIGASFTMETDPFGTFIASSFSYASARDWALFGQLYLNDGVWEGKRLFPEGWVKYTTTPTKNSFNLYGSHWWLGGADKLVPSILEEVQQLYSSFEKGTYLASGYGGQFTVVVPQHNLVFTRLGFTPAKNESFPISEVVKKVLEVLK